MTATDELRRLLDERGVPWKDYGYENHTWWGEWHAENRASVDGLFLKVEGVVTPEEAIEATLGGGLQAENDKLRDLVRELWNCALQYHRFDVYRHEIGVDGCGIGCTANGDDCCACKLEQRMRELGVEV